MNNTSLENIDTRSDVSVWKNKNYVILLLTGIFITFGSKVYELAIPLIIYELTKSSVSMGLMSAIEFLPNMIFAVFIGAFIDYIHNKKAFITFTVLLQSLILFALFILMKTEYFALPYMYIFAFILMTLNYGYYNARFVIIKQTLPPSLYMKSTASFTFITMLVTVVSPALTGFILIFSDVKNSLIIVAITLLISTLLTLLLETYQEPTSTANKKNFLFSDIKFAWDEFKKIRVLWTLTWFVVFTNASYGMFNAMIIFFSKESLNLGSSEIGILLSSLGLGGVFGTMVLGRLRSWIGLGKTIGICIAITGITYVSLFIISNFYLLCTSLFLVGIFATAFSVCIHTYRQEVTPVDIIGRVVGITGSIFKLAMPLCIFGAGWMANLVSVEVVFLICGIGNLLLFLIFLFTPIWKEI